MMFGLSLQLLYISFAYDQDKACFIMTKLALLFNPLYVITEGAHIACLSYIRFGFVCFVNEHNFTH